MEQEQINFRPTKDTPSTSWAQRLTLSYPATNPLPQRLIHPLPSIGCQKTLTNTDLYSPIPKTMFNINMSPGIGDLSACDWPLISTKKTSVSMTLTKEK